MTDVLTPEMTAQRVSANLKKTDRAIAKFTKQLTTLVPEEVPIDSVKPNTWNPNSHSPEQFTMLKTSIMDDGFTLPIVVNSENTIVDGEHRWRACLELGYETIWLVRVEMTDAQAKISTIRHNVRGSHDPDLETGVFRDLQEMGSIEWLQSALLITDEQINIRLQDDTAAEALGDKEFNAAWIPTTVNPAETQRILDGTMGTEAVRAADSAGNPMDIGLTPQAIAVQHKAVSAAVNETNEVERAIIQKANKDVTVRVLLTFRGEDAQQVQRILGRRPAVTLLDFCVQELSSATT